MPRTRVRDRLSEYDKQLNCSCGKRLGLLRADGDFVYFDLRAKHDDASPRSWTWAIECPRCGAPWFRTTEALAKLYAAADDRVTLT
jgi:hypothetical protein